ncbi:MAG: DUF3060 domain-containing protein [Acidobacteria bacterium]|nr:DUF3060 domain-containing protein [Acidobacteriota bacterium]
MLHRFSLKSLLLVLAMALSASKAWAQTDLSWVAGLRGLSSGVQTQEGGTTKIVYTYSSDPGPIMRELRRGLEERGWKVDEDEGVTVAGLAVAGTLTAKKDRAVLEVSSAGAPGVAGSHTLVLELEGATTAPPAKAKSAAAAPPAKKPSSSGAPAEPPKPAVPAPPADKPQQQDVVTIHESGITRAIACRDTVVAVNGNSCDLTLTGSCRALKLNGNKNKVKMLGSIARIEAYGNDNSAFWSPSANPQRPSVVNYGSRNEIAALKE